MDSCLTRHIELVKMWRETETTGFIDVEYIKMVNVYLKHIQFIS